MAGYVSVFAMRCLSGESLAAALWQAGAATLVIILCMQTFINLALKTIGNDHAAHEGANQKPQPDPMPETPTAAPPKRAVTH